MSNSKSNQKSKSKQNHIQIQDFSDSIIQPFDTQSVNYQTSSVFGLISFFEASYLRLQASHVPFDDEKGIMN